MGKFDNTEIQRECKTASFKINRIHNDLSKLMVGRKAKIISDFNGQMYGKSKKSMKGREFVVESVHVSATDCCVFSWKVSNLFIPVEEVDFIEN